MDGSKIVPSRAIVSNNCWGGSLYAELGTQYNTPFVGLWLYADDYLRLLSDFRNMVRCELTFAQKPRRGNRAYPVGILGESVEIEFMHYQTEDEARRKWTDRAARLPMTDDDLCIKIDDRDGLTRDHLDKFSKLPFQRKVAFLKRGKFNITNYDWVVEIDTQESVVTTGVNLWHATKKHESFNAYDWVGLNEI